MTETDRLFKKAANERMMENFDNAVDEICKVAIREAEEAVSTETMVAHYMKIAALELILQLEKETENENQEQLHNNCRMLVQSVYLSQQEQFQEQTA